MKHLLRLLLLLPVFAFAQDKGIHFQHGLSWKALQAKAKAEKKFIFVDCFTTWCGPCKYMSKSIFPLEEVGSFFNQKYLSVKIQLDTTATDNAEVKSWYKDGQDIARQYKVRAYPTYLFFDPNGTIVHRSVGSSDAKVFLAKAHDALDPEKQYYTLLNQYEKGKKDPAFLRSLALVANDAYDQQNAGKLSEEYLGTQTNLYTKENISFINEFTNTSRDKGFDVFFSHPDEVDAALGKGKARQKVTSIIQQEEVFPVIFQQPPTDKDWNELSANLNQKYPGYANEVLASSKVIYYQYKQDWPNFQTEVVKYMKTYGANTAPEELNNFAWTVFQNCKDMTCVAEALDWSKRSFADKDNPMFIDTYANILYKLGRKDEAIQWEEKALLLVGDGDKKTYTETLNKMKKGEKTWD